MDVSAKQRLCLETCLFTFGGLSGGFAPRHLRRYVARVKMEAFELLKKKCEESNHSVSAREWNQIRKATDYPNFRTVKSWIRDLEAAVAKSFADINFDDLASDNSKIRQLEIDFEWFLTWRVKLTRFPHLVWCDGVEIIELKHYDKLTYIVEAKIWLGPESNVNIEFLCEMKGVITFNKKFDALEDYKFEVAYEKQKFLICKAT